VKLNGDFFARRHAPATFCSAKKFGEIDPWRSLDKTRLMIFNFCPSFFPQKNITKNFRFLLVVDVDVVVAAPADADVVVVVLPIVVIVVFVFAFDVIAYVADDIAPVVTFYVYSEFQGFRS
jgi:hypothetical protein